jgi:hypothetical protein
MHLSPDQVAAAVFVGVGFPRASPDQVQRLSMQRKVFRIGGEAVLATRDGSFFETAATLERLIAKELGARQARALAAWEASGSTEPSPAPGPTLGAVPPALPEPPAAMAEPLELVVAETPVAAPAPVVPAGALVAGNAARKTASVRKLLPGERWLTAGAERRGRTPRHWSARQRS